MLFNKVMNGSPLGSQMQGSVTPFSRLPTGPSISTSSLPDGTQNVAYSQQMSGTGTGITWSKVSGTFPTGVTISAAGLISGTPSNSGTFASLVIAATDFYGRSTTVTLSITVAAGDYTTNMVGKYQSGSDADFALTTDNIDTWIEKLGGNTDKDIIFVGGGGYATKAKHRTTIGINGDKVVEVMGAGDYQTRVGGTTADFFNTANASFTVILRVHSIIAAFGTADCILVEQSGAFKIEAVNSSGLKFRFSSGAMGTGNAQDAGTLDVWTILRCRIDDSDKKAKLTVGDAAEVLSTAGSSSFPNAANNRWNFTADTGTGARSDVAIHQIRVFNELLSDANWTIIKSTERALHAAIA